MCGCVGWRVELGVGFVIRGGALDGEPKDGRDDVHRLVFPPDGTAAVCCVVPVARTCCVKTRPCLLQDHHRHCGQTQRGRARGGQCYSLKGSSRAACTASQSRWRCVDMRHLRVAHGGSGRAGAGTRRPRGQRSVPRPKRTALTNVFEGLAQGSEPLQALLHNV